MQRSSWQMLQSNLVWQAGHLLIQQIQSHINVTRKESDVSLCRCDIIVDGEVQGGSRSEREVNGHITFVQNSS